MRPLLFHVNAAACGMRSAVSVLPCGRSSTLCRVDVYTEIGTRRVFAGALEWPGWCRSGRSEDDALRALLQYAPRYAEVMAGSRFRFRAPGSLSDLKVVDRLPGDATTDFGAPSVAPTVDRRDAGMADLARLQAMLEASWGALDGVVQAAEGRTLTTGPRGGGRTLQAIVTHVTEAEASYLSRLGARRPEAGATESRAAALEVRTTIADALARAVEHGLPERGPRGGVIWTPRYLVRRTAWHALDHAWEIEDRSGLRPATP